MDWQQLLVYAIVAGAAAYLVRRRFRRGAGGCGGCNSCETDKRPTGGASPSLVQLELGPPPAREDRA